VDLDNLHKAVMDFDLELRNENSFNDKLYTTIYHQLEILFEQWKTQDSIPKSAFISCIYMVDILAGGSRFWSDDVCQKAEDAIIAIQKLVTNIDEHTYSPL
jgi:hypothetical protein